MGLLVSLAWPSQIALFALGPPRAVLYAATLVAGMGLGLLGVWWETALAQRIPAQMLSRVSAWDWMGSLALLPVGYLLAGPVAHAIGAVHELVIGGLLGTVTMTFGLLPRSSRALGRIAEPTLEPTATPAPA